MIEPLQDKWLATRQTLLSRLKNWDDQRGWQEFFDTYWRLIYGVARKAGLTETEAQEVLQETIISVARQMPKFQYNGQHGSFKGWLLQTTRWRIADQFRKRPPTASLPSSEDESRTSEVERVADPAANLESLWEEAWQRNLFEAAIERIKVQVEPKEFQIFELHVLREWPVKRVAQRLHTTQAHVYYAKYKVSRLVQRETKALAKTMSSTQEDEMLC